MGIFLAITTHFFDAAIKHHCYYRCTLSTDQTFVPCAS